MRTDHIEDGIGCLADLVNRHNKSYPERYIGQSNLDTLESILIKKTFSPGRLVCEDDF